jgi:hypothetical protein
VLGLWSFWIFKRESSASAVPLVFKPVRNKLLNFRRNPTIASQAQIPARLIQDLCSAMGMTHVGCEILYQPKTQSEEVIDFGNLVVKQLSRLPNSA